MPRPAGAAPDTLPRSAQARLDRLAAGVAQDVHDAHALAVLLEEQFDAALHHDGSRLQQLAPHIEALVDRMETRRGERVLLAESLLGRGARMAALITRLPAARQPALAAAWSALEQQVRQCKALNQRNCGLMTGQQDILQRVLHGEAETYAPA